MVRKDFVLILALIFVTLFSLNFVSATTTATIDAGIQDYANRTIEAQINISVNNTGDSGNITALEITFPAQTTFSLNSNYTNIGWAYNFTNYTNTDGQMVINWNNTDGLINNLTGDLTGVGNTEENFSFNVIFYNPTMNTFNVNATYSGGDNSTTFVMPVFFEFSGYTKNETGDYQNITNVSMYGVEPGVNGPPTETILDSVISTGTDGFFIFPALNYSSSFYKLKFIYYNSTEPASTVTGGATRVEATKVGTILPQFPLNMYYPTYGFEAYDMGLNGSTFYLQDASTLNLTAANSTGDIINFGYEVTDQLLGFPIESNVFGNVSSADIVVPSGRDYSVMMLRDFSQFPVADGNCTTEFLSSGPDQCPAPPKSNSTIGATWSTLTSGATTNVQINLTVSKIYVYGCIAIADGNNNTEINVTNIIPRLLPWSGFVITSMKADDNSINITDNKTILNAPFVEWETEFCNKLGAANTTSFYNLSLLANSEYMLEFYGKNSTASLEGEEGNPGSGGWNLAAFQNLSTGTSDMYQNITLYRLVGDYVESTEKNTSQMIVNIQNATGDAIPTQIGHVQIKVKHDVFGTINYIIEETSITNGTFYFPILNNSNWAKIYVFGQNSPPKERTLDLTVSENNITLISVDFSENGDKGIRTTSSSGDFTTLETNATGYNLELEFLRTDGVCDVVNPGENCIITEMNATSFNPLKALVAGKVNMRLKFSTSGTSLLFHQFDMFSAKQPPMSSVINTAPLTSSSNSQIWEFGSFAPSDAYKNVTIAMPYSDDDGSTTYVNDSNTVYVSLPLLYEESSTDQNAWIVSWNRTRGDTGVNLTDALIDYNDTAFSGFLSSTGIECSSSNAAAVCFIDNSNNTIYITVPHFSGTSPNVAGTTPDAGTPASSTSPGGGNLPATETWSKTIILSNEEFTAGATKELGTKERATFKIDGTEHQVGVTEVTATSVKIKVSSDPQEATLSIGDEKKFEVTNDTFYDISVKLDSITSNKASLTIKSIHEEIKAEEQKEEKKEEKKVGEVIEEFKTENPWLFWTIVVVVIVIIVATIAYILYKKKRYSKKGY